MTLSQRIELLQYLRKYMQRNDDQWQQTKQLAFAHNAWFTPQMIDLAVDNICTQFLEAEKLASWAQTYAVPQETPVKKTVGLVMAGNLPLVGFHDWLAVFITGHYSLVKPSSKDDVLLKAMVQYLYEITPLIQDYTGFAEILQNCDAYIATGSANSSRYFAYYFGKYPNIIRRNKTSVALLTGQEDEDALHALANDMNLYFGMGCRNVTQLYVPEGYDFVPLINALKKYDHHLDHNKMKNNYDYQLALMMMNSRPYMTGGPVILAQSDALFSPVSVVNWQYYSSREQAVEKLNAHEGVQCIVGNGFVPFGEAQSPGLTQYADGVDVMQFLRNL